jgi:hypothetical protein
MNEFSDKIGLPDILYLRDREVIAPACQGSGIYIFVDPIFPWI